MIRVLVTLAVITALAAAAAHFGYQELENRLQASSCLPAPPAKTGGLSEDGGAGPASEPEGPPSAQNFQIIVSRDIFRSAAAKQEKRPDVKPPPPQPETVLPTTLNLTLAGTVLGSGQTSRAIIISNTGRDRNQQLLQIGDGVPGTAAVIKEISWESVTLEVNGKKEVLTMPKPKSAPGFGPQAMAAPSAPASFEPPPFAEETRRGRPPVRPNRRISLPPEDPVEPADFAAEEPSPEEEIPSPVQPEVELPPLDAE